jgi:cob(I)alamin adenosyltransferase
MQGATAIMLAIIVIGLPTTLIFLMANRFFKFRERKLEIEALNAAEKAAQYASRSNELEQRVRVLEQIVTDGGAQTAAQIEALRTPVRRVASRKTGQPNDDVAG